MNTNSENRVMFHTTRFAPCEAAEVVQHADACGISISALIRGRVLGHELPKGAAPPINMRAYTELRSSTANFNQMTHHFNRAALTGEVYPTNQHVLDKLNEVSVELKNVSLQLIGAKK